MRRLHPFPLRQVAARVSFYSTPDTWRSELLRLMAGPSSLPAAYAGEGGCKTMPASFQRKLGVDKLDKQARAALFPGTKFHSYIV